MLLSGNSCRCICKQGLWEGRSNCISSITGSLQCENISLSFCQKLISCNVTSNYLQLGLVLGLALAFILGTGLHFGAKLFTKDVDVIHLIRIGIPVTNAQITTSFFQLQWNSVHNDYPDQFVAATQPLNALAFVFDGINFGASDFAYSAISLVGIFLSCHDRLYNALLLITMQAQYSKLLHIIIVWYERKNRYNRSWFFSSLRSFHFHRLWLQFSA